MIQVLRIAKEAIKAAISIVDDEVSKKNISEEKIETGEKYIGEKT